MAKVSIPKVVKADCKAHCGFSGFDRVQYFWRLYEINETQQRLMGQVDLTDKTSSGG